MKLRRKDLDLEVMSSIPYWRHLPHNHGLVKVEGQILQGLEFYEILQF